MNIRFKMPRFGRNLTNRGVVKELLLTTLATTISIVLTFGTAHFVEQRQNDEARRLLAMTIICDIDETLGVFKRLLDIEDKGSTISYFLLNNMDRLESISDDTLFVFFNYVTNTSFNAELEFKKTNEEIFNSSQDSWRTLNDRKFLNNVQEFYNARALFDRQRKEWMYFQKPVTQEDAYNIFMISDDMSSREAFINTCRRLLNSNKVKKYLETSYNRKNFYRSFLNLVNLNEQNKFLMNITEQDLEDFKDQTYMTVRPIKDKELVGTWEVVMTDDKRQVAFEFRKDHTFTTRQSIWWSHTLIMNKIYQRYTISGTWAIKGDSLVMNYDLKSYKLKVEGDFTPYQPNMKDEAEKVRQEMAGENMKPDFIRQVEQNSRIAQATNLDQTETRLELTDANENPVHYRRQNVKSE